LHCLEVDPRQRYQSAAHLAFDLRHPELVRLTARAERSAGGGAFAALSGWLRQALARVAIAPAPIAVGDAASIIVAAVDLGEEDAALIEFARRNHVRHLIMGARAASKTRRFIGSVSAKVVAEAPCSVTVVRA